MIEVREAQVEDAEGIGSVHVRAWQHAYAGLMPQEFLDRLDVARGARHWRAVLSGEVEWEGGSTVDALVALRDGTVAGFVVAGSSRDPDVDESIGELHAINVDPDHWGTGVGAALFEAAEARLRAAGYRRATLWVVDGNTRARRFYERYGWAPDGTEKVDDRFGPSIVEVRYAVDL